MASYRYLRDISPDDISPEAPRVLTRKEAVANWWHYHWKWVLAGVLAVAAAAYAIYSVTLGRGPAPDYELAIVTPSTLPESAQTALETALESLADDANGDGRVVVQIHVYTTDLADTLGADAYTQMGGAIQLTADLEQNLSGIFVLADPAAFSRYTGALRYLDGTLGPTDEEGSGPADWYNMVYRWGDCPALAQLPGCDALAGYYVGFRGALTDKSRSALANDETLWALLTANAVSTAAEDAA